MDNRFRLAKWNIVFIIFAVLGTLTFRLIECDSWDDITGNIIKIAAMVSAVVLVPLFFAWIVWRLFEKNPKVLQWTFCIVLTLVVSAQNKSFIKRTEARVEQSKQDNVFWTDMRLWRNRLASLHEALSKAQTPEEVLKIRDRDNAQQGTSVGDNNQLVTFMGENEIVSNESLQMYKVEQYYMVLQHTHRTKMNRVTQAISQPEILHADFLRSSKDFAGQRKIIQDFIAQAEANLKYVNSSVESQEKEMQQLAKTPGQKEYVDCIMSGFKKGFNIGKPIAQQLLKTYIQWGQNLLRQLDFLEKHQTEWSSDKGDFLFPQQENFDKFNKMFEEGRALADKMIQLEKEVLARASKLEQ